VKPSKRPLTWAALVVLVLIIAVGTDLYQERQLAVQRAEAQALSRQAKALAGQLQQLERECDQATHLLAALQQENARLQSGQKVVELLRLRGQVGVLRQQVAATGPGVSPALLCLLRQDPALQRYVREGLRGWVQLNAGSLFRELKLTPEQAEKALQLWADLEFKRVEALSAAPPGTLRQEELGRAEDRAMAEIYQQLQPVLGETGMVRFKAEREAWPAGYTVEMLCSQLGTNQLSEAQAKRLVEVVKAEPFQLTQGVIDGWDAAFWAPPQDIQNHVSRIEQSNERILQQANTFLSPEQVSVLTQVLSNGLNARLSFAAAYIQKR
jgi:hypothetical protein